jgi:hypothetical protein
MAQVERIIMDDEDAVKADYQKIIIQNSELKKKLNSLLKKCKCSRSRP